MKLLARTILAGACAALLGSLAAFAGAYTVHLSTGEKLETRYPPRFDDRGVQLLSKAGEWRTLSHDQVLQVIDESDVDYRSRMLDSKTILIGWTANDAASPSSRALSRPREAAAGTAALDPIAVLLSYAATSHKPAQAYDFSVPQFVDAEETSGGIPMLGIFRFDAPEEETLIEIFGVPRRQLTQGLGPFGFQRIQGLLPPNGFERGQGLPPGGFQSIQGIPVGLISAAEGPPPG